MKKCALTLVASWVVFSAVAQDVELDIHGKRLADFVKIEQRLHGELMENRAQHVVPGGVAQPLSFRRKQKGLPDLVTQYFYYKSDSSIHYVLYEWDDQNFLEYGAVQHKTPKEVDAFVAKFRQLEAQVVKKYGAPAEKEGALDDRSKVKTGEFKQSDRWAPNDSTSIKLYTDLSSKHERNGNVGVDPVYRIRLYVNNKKEKVAPVPTPTAEQVSAYDKVFRSFLSSLLAKNFIRARVELSTAIIAKVTDEQLTQLASMIRADDELVVYMTSVQTTMTGESYPVIQYKYKSDTSSPPRQMVTTYYDDKGKLIGIQPVELQGQLK